METIFDQNSNKRYILYGTEDVINKIKNDLGEVDRIRYCIMPKNQYFKFLEDNKVYVVEDNSHCKVIVEYNNEFY